MGTILSLPVVALEKKILVFEILQFLINKTFKKMKDEIKDKQKWMISVVGNQIKAKIREMSRSGYYPTPEQLSCEGYI